MKISVIVPYEGYYQYLKDCLESLSEDVYKRQVDEWLTEIQIPIV